jgi:hypothetical protein
MSPEYPTVIAEQWAGAVNDAQKIAHAGQYLNEINGKTEPLSSVYEEIGRVSTMIAEQCESLYWDSKRQRAIRLVTDLKEARANLENSTVAEDDIERIVLKEKVRLAESPLRYIQYPGQRIIGPEVAQQK